MSNDDTNRQKKKTRTREKLANTGKIVIAVLLVLLVLPTMGMVWVKDGRQAPGYCASCHEDPYYTSWSDPELHFLAQKHAAVGISCQTCHGRSLSESTMEVVNYVIGNYYYPFEEIELSMETCFACHVDYDTVISLTLTESTSLERNPHAGHWGELECGLCHNMHRESIYYCANCHKPILEKPGWQN